jgi:hypothetical protein
MSSIEVRMPPPKGPKTNYTAEINSWDGGPGGGGVYRDAPSGAEDDYTSVREIVDRLRGLPKIRKVDLLRSQRKLGQIKDTAVGYLRNQIDYAFPVGDPEREDAIYAYSEVFGAPEDLGTVVSCLASLHARLQRLESHAFYGQ